MASEPPGAKPQLEAPDRKHDEIKLQASQVADKPKTSAREQNKCNQRVHKIVGKCHLPYGGKSVQKPLRKTLLYPPDNKRHIT